MLTQLKIITLMGFLISCGTSNPDGKNDNSINSTADDEELLIALEELAETNDEGEVTNLEGFVSSETLDDDIESSQELRNSYADNSKIFEFSPPSGVEVDFSEPIMVTGASLALASNFEEICSNLNYQPEEPRVMQLVEKASENNACGKIKFNFCVKLYLAPTDTSSLLLTTRDSVFVQVPPIVIDIPCKVDSFENTSISIANGNPSTDKVSETVNINAKSSVTQVYLTNQEACDGGGQWENISEESLPWNLEFIDNKATVYAKFRDVYMQESECFSDSILNKGALSNVAVLSGLPANPSDNNTLDISVSGTNVSNYKYSIIDSSANCHDADYNESWISVSEPITSRVGHLNAELKICVVGQSESKDEQPTNFASEYIWTQNGTWKLQVTTTAPQQSMTVGLTLPDKILVNWGDGSPIEEISSTGGYSHVYPDPGVYTMEISGKASEIRFNYSDAQSRLTQILSQVKGISGLTSFESSFAGTSGLTGSIPAGLFDNTPLVTSFASTFSDSGISGSIPDGLFNNNPLVTSFDFTFFNTSLTGTIPAGLFDQNQQVTSFIGTFSRSGISGAIPAGLFNNNPLVTSFYGIFDSMLSLIGPIPAGLFDNNPLVTSFDFTFSNASSLSGPIPAGLFDNNPNVTSFNGTFSDTEISGAIPAGLFDNNPNVTSFNGTFWGSEISGAIPAGLFDNNPLVTDFDYTFYGTASLTEPIPAGLFDKNPQVTSFSGTFSYSGVSGAIPAGLFDNNPLVVSFLHAFSNSQISGIPSGLFDKNLNASNFKGTFMETNIASIPVDIFSTIPDGSSLSFVDTFANSSDVVGSVPDLWNSFPLANGLGCFQGLSSAVSNLSSIPTQWQ